MGNRDIKDAHPRLQAAWEHVTENFAKKYPTYPKFILSEVYRSADLQRAYYAQGRDPLARVNSQRRLVGLAPITEEENRRKITNSKPGQSKHQRYPAEAIDILFIEPGTKKISENPIYYTDMAKMVRAFDLGITWGGDWNKNWNSGDERLVDRPHFEV